MANLWPPATEAGGEIRNPSAATKHVARLKTNTRANQSPIKPLSGIRRQSRQKSLLEPNPVSAEKPEGRARETEKEDDVGALQETETPWMEEQY